MSELVSGHGLVAKGAAFSARGYRSRYNTVAGEGHAMCSCGAISGHSYPSAAARKRWHRDHKAEVSRPEATS